MTGAELLANDLKQISDCTGDRVTMLFDTASQNKIQGTKAMRKFANFIYKVNLNVVRHYIKIVMNGAGYPLSLIRKASINSGPVLLIILVII